MKNFNMAVMALCIVLLFSYATSTHLEKWIFKLFPSRRDKVLDYACIILYYKLT